MSTIEQNRVITIESLPHGVLSHIAAYLTNGTHTDSALFFAQTSAAAREAVLDALSYRIDYTTEDDTNIFQNLTAWTKVFAKSSRHIIVNLVSPRWISCNDFDDLNQVPEHLLRLLSHNIYKAIVPYQPKWLFALKSAPHLRELHIRASRRINRQLLLDTLEKLSLHKLTLSCVPQSYIRCIFNQCDLFDRYDGIIQACPGLLELGAECNCGCAVWPMLCSRPMVTPCSMSIECRNGMPTEFVHLAALHGRNIFSILDLQPPRGDKSLTLALSSSLTELHVPLAQRSFQCHADFACLSVCSKLEKLSIVLGAGAETLLPGLISNWPELRVLELQWDYDIDDSSKVRPNWPQVTPGSLIRIAQSAPKLQNIAMKEIKVSIREVTAVMKVLGSRLTRIGISNENQAEGPLDRYKEMLETAITWNPALREITCYDSHIIEAAQPEVHEQLFTLIIRLERAAPCFFRNFPSNSCLTGLTPPSCSGVRSMCSLVRI